MVHKIKLKKEHYNDVFMGHKTFEVRLNDRNYQKGDLLILQEWDDDEEKYTGLELARNITYVLNGGEHGIQEGYVVMSIG